MAGSARPCLGLLMDRQGRGPLLEDWRSHYGLLEAPPSTSFSDTRTPPALTVFSGCLFGWLVFRLLLLSVHQNNYFSFFLLCLFSCFTHHQSFYSCFSGIDIKQRHCI